MIKIWQPKYFKYWKAIFSNKTQKLRIFLLWLTLSYSLKSIMSLLSSLLNQVTTSSIRPYLLPKHWHSSRILHYDPLLQRMYHVSSYFFAEVTVLHLHPIRALFHWAESTLQLWKNCGAMLVEKPHKKHILATWFCQGRYVISYSSYFCSRLLCQILRKTRWCNNHPFLIWVRRGGVTHRNIWYHSWISIRSV